MANRNRCPWVDLNKPLYVHYHDHEWGVPIYDDRKLFEFLVLESAQAGLSWYTVLCKRENYRQAFDQFDPQQIAAYDQRRIEQLLRDTGIIRNRRKIEATINNARRYLKLVEEQSSFSRFLWQFVAGSPNVNHFTDMTDYPAYTPTSERMSSALKKQGFKFVGPTICYAFMQATGMVNDHVIGCYRRDELVRE